MTPKHDPIRTAREAAEQMNCSVDHVYDLYNRGELLGFKHGRRKGLRFRQSVIEAHLFALENVGKRRQRRFA